MLATVVRAEKPTSAKPGAKALIKADGEWIGWIGGSCSKPAVEVEAKKVLASGQPKILQLSSTETCASGGSLDIYLEPHLAEAPSGRRRPPARSRGSGGARRTSRFSGHRHEPRGVERAVRVRGRVLRSNRIPRSSSRREVRGRGEPRELRRGRNPRGARREAARLRGPGLEPKAGGGHAVDPRPSPRRRGGDSSSRRDSISAPRPPRRSRSASWRRWCRCAGRVADRSDSASDRGQAPR